MKVVDLDRSLNTVKIGSLEAGRIFVFADEGNTFFMRVIFEDIHKNMVISKYRDFSFYCDIENGCVGMTKTNAEVIPMMGECRIQGTINV